MNPGKAFEADFVSSIPDSCYHYRLRDTSSSWQGGECSRFTVSNVCDFIVYTKGCLYMLELKSHKGKSLPLSCIRPNQIEGLLQAHYKAIRAGLVVNFRDIEKTFYISIFDIKAYIDNNNKKSIPLSYLEEKGEVIESKKKVTRYSYNLKKFLEG